jgi:O-antigen ligase
LAGLLALTALAYALDYSEAVKSTQALTLLGAAMLGQGAGLWEGRSPKSEVRSPKSKVQSPKSKTVVGVLVVLLLGAVVWQPEAGHDFQYRGQTRWSGPWDNPNTFGMLMAVGVVLAVELLAQSRKSKVQSLPSAECGGHRTSNTEPRTVRWGRWLRAGLFGAAAGGMGWGLIRSYSRGAWVGAAVGLAYLGYQIGKAEKLKAEIRPGLLCWAGRRWVALAVICASVGVLAFWNFRHTDRAMARRAYSAANVNDFSWRNRVAAWEGSLQMLADKPWFGFGWNQPERVYDQYYRAAKVGEGMALQMNDYLILGMTLGLPALVCFSVYLWLGLVQGSPMANRKSQMAGGDWLKAACRAGTVVLLVGFWFDGGLFKLATGATFWILLELGRMGDHEMHEAHEND